MGAGNPYQGGRATLTVIPFYSGIAAPTLRPSPTPGTPPPPSTTGAGPMPASGLLLVGVGRGCS